MPKDEKELELQIQAGGVHTSLKPGKENNLSPKEPREPSISRSMSSQTQNSSVAGANSVSVLFFLNEFSLFRFCVFFILLLVCFLC